MTKRQSELIGILKSNGSRLNYIDLAKKLYPDSKSWRIRNDGGPPGCYMSMTRMIRSLQQAGRVRVSTGKHSRTFERTIVLLQEKQ